MTSMFDSLEGVDESLAKSYADNLLLPAPGDTLNDSTQVKEIFSGILNHSIFGKSYSENISIAAENHIQHFQIDTLRLDGTTVVVSPNCSYLTSFSLGGNKIIAADYAELIGYANRNGARVIYQISCKNIW